jgi:alcohol dehydrogenase
MVSTIQSFYCPTRIFTGVNSHQKLPDIVKEWRCETLFVLADSAVVKTEIFASIEKLLRDSKVAFDVFTEIEPDPSAETVHKAFNLYQNSKAPAVLALGGGSTMDTGKSVCILAKNGGRINDYEGIEKFSVPPLPLIAIPTTAGTGSEVSGSCTITDTARGLKMSIRHASLNPARVAILDPVALKTLPASVAAHAAVDAFTHAFESYVSLHANAHTDAINLYAMELMAQHIRPFVANRANLEAGLNMGCAANLAGITFGQTGVGNIHCMARFVGAFCHVPHGLSTAVCFPAAAEFNLLANPKKYARVAAAMGENIHGLTETEAARKACQAISSMCKDLGIPDRLRDVGATEEMLPQMAKLSANAGYNKWNPRFTTERDFMALFEKAY